MQRDPERGCGDDGQQRPEGLRLEGGEEIAVGGVGEGGGHPTGRAGLTERQGPDAGVESELLVGAVASRRGGEPQRDHENGQGDRGHESRKDPLGSIRPDRRTQGAPGLR